MQNNKVLIIEDDKEIADIVATNIEDLGLKSEHISDGKSGLSLALSGEYALIILDIMLPKLDGISICKNIREKNPNVPILILTAKADEIDRVLGLELGADDYMIKPFSVRELIARVKALLRRSNTESISNKEESKPSVSIGDLEIDFNKRKITLKKKEIEMTVKEFELLDLFIHNPGRAFSRTDLLNLVWGYQFEGYEHTVNTHINRLRNKIEEDPAHPKYLKTVWGVGYRFAENNEFLL
jgi:DNA-binding response OmpR family regulator